MEASSSLIPENTVKIYKNSLPEEITTDIISRLPVKRVLQAQCLSKNLSSIATDPHFINAHLRQSSRIRPSIILNNGNHVYMIQYSGGQESEYTVKEVPLPCNIQSYTTSCKLMIVASCDGLVVLAFNNYCFLWNPSTNQCSPLPTPRSFPNMRFVSVSWGFGYCTKSRVYKIVRLVFGRNFDLWSNSICFAEVFSCGTDMSWRRLDLSKFSQPVRSLGTAIKGSVYWGVANQIFAFDLAKETFSLASIPVSMCETIMEFRGSLAVCCRSKVSRNSLELWVMKGDKCFAFEECSWEKTYTTVELDDIVYRVDYNVWRADSFPLFTFPTRCLNDRQLLIINDPTKFDRFAVGDFTCYLYDLESNEIKKVPKIFAYSKHVVHNFVESLVPLYLCEYSSSDNDIIHKDEGIDND